MNRRILLYAVSFSLLFLAANAWAQFAQRGGIEGTVFDQSGAVVPGAQPDRDWKAMKKAGKKLFQRLGALRDVQIMMEWIEEAGHAEA